MKKVLSLFVIVLIAVTCFTITDVYAKDKSCQTIDGAYYGKNGKETDKGTYEKECLKHTCEPVADTYFGKDGTEVSYDQFQSECESSATVVNDLPNTGSYLSIITLLLGISIVSFAGLKILNSKEQ